MCGRLLKNWILLLLLDVVITIVLKLIIKWDIIYLQVKTTFAIKVKIMITIIKEGLQTDEFIKRIFFFKLELVTSIKNFRCKMENILIIIIITINK